MEEITGYGTMRPKNLISSLLGQTPVKSKSLAISNPHDFRQVSCVLVIYRFLDEELINQNWIKLLNSLSTRLKNPSTSVRDFPQFHTHGVFTEFTPVATAIFIFSTFLHLIITTRNSF